MRTTALTGATVFTGDELHENCSVVIEDGVIADLAPDGAPVRGAGTAISLRGRRLAPGFIDIQVNGGGGVLFNNAPTAESLRAIGAAHARFGTTAFLPTLISDDYAVMRAAIAAVRRARRERMPGVLGVHLEGPFLNPERRGAHDAAKFRRIDDEALELVTSLGRDGVTLLTLAPEMTSPEIIGRLRGAGVIVFAGHSAADYGQCRAALAAGVTGFTHLFNAMTPMTARAPGMVGAALESEDSVFSIIADGHHVHPAPFRAAIEAKRRGGAVLVTDAMPTVGSEDTVFELGGERIELRGGALRNRRGSLAGSNLSMIDAVRNAMRMAGLDWREAVRMASSYPARAIGVDDRRGFIRPGYAADLVELDRDMVLHRTWVAGVPA